MTVSVIIPCYNCINTIDNCVSSIINFSNNIVNEIILVDDCSTDNTLQVLNNLKTKRSTLIKIISTNINSGPAVARNTGAEKAISEFLIFFDSDTIVRENTIFLINSELFLNDAVVGTYDKEPITKGFSQYYKALLYSYMLSKKGVVNYDQFSASCSGIRKSVFSKLGGYNSKFPKGLDFENEEFGSRISASYKMILNPSIIVYHEFPGFVKMTKTFFYRTSFWVEMFYIRKKFNSVGGTKENALSILFFSFFFILSTTNIVYFDNWPLQVCALILYILFFYINFNFIKFVFNFKKHLLFPVVMLHHYYSLIIFFGACFGLLKIVLKKSKILAFKI